MSNAGSALMGIGSARGEDRAVAAAEMAISSPLLEAEHRRRARRPAVGLRRLRPRPVRDQRGGQPGRTISARRGQHHLRCGDRRRAGRRGSGHGHRGGLRRRHAEAPRTGVITPVEHDSVAGLGGRDARRPRPPTARRPPTRRDTAEIPVREDAMVSAPSASREPRRIVPRVRRRPRRPRLPQVVLRHAETAGRSAPVRADRPVRRRQWRAVRRAEPRRPCG